jgi:hypothetical protein
LQALKRAGGRLRYTEYPDVAHAAWERAYADKKAIGVAAGRSGKTARRRQP